MKTLRINPRRFQRDFEQLAQIGSTGNGGVHRPALTENHLRAREWYRARIAADGLAHCQDGAGNHSARLPSPSPDARTLLLGSHLDSVPNGGRFDGALGLLAAYEVLRTIRDAGLQLPVHLEAIDFTDEEGTFLGLLGSRALTGALSPGDLAIPRGGREPLLAGLARAGLTEESVLRARRDPQTLAGFLELHIEQGPRLLDAQADIGIVTTIVGIGSFALTFAGRADHAGTTAMDARRDAGLGAAAFMVAAREKTIADFPGCVINFGHVHFEPGAYNIVPQTAHLALEYRAPHEDELEALEDMLLALAQQTAHTHQLTLTYEKKTCIAAAPCSPLVQRAFAAACDTLNLKHTPLVSGAGHDTQSLAAVCPAGMIFIPSTGGSHNPNEFAERQDCVNGADVMLHAALEMAVSA